MVPRQLHTHHQSRYSPEKCRQDFVTGFPSKPSVSGFDGKRRRSGINELSDKSGSKCYKACGDEGARQGERKRRACQTRPQGWNRYGVWQSVFVKGVNVISVQGLQQKESRRNCCNSPAARRVPKNAGSICKQLNREDSQIQDFSFVNFERSTEALCADSW